MSGGVPIGHVGLTVPDLHGAIEWYRDIFGWELLMGPVELSGEDPRVGAQVREVFGRERIAFRQAHLAVPEGGAVELFEFLDPPSHPRAQFEPWCVGVFHICVVDPEIEALAARIEGLGGRRRCEVQEIFPGEPYRFCYCEDPFGNVIEIATHPHAEAFGGRQAY
jgi:catechol 2,3-dioxygenase-like lactoylglutathione lyase family enzyme